MNSAIWCGIASLPGATGLAAVVRVVISEDEFSVVTMGFLTLVGVAVMLLAWASLAAMRSRLTLGHAMALGGSTLLLLLASISGFSVGLFLLPGALVGVIAAALWRPGTVEKSAPSTG